MGRATASLPQGFAATDASFRTWGSGISALMDSAGFAKTSDTGQINWTTVTKPTAANTVAGYEIRKIANSTLGDLYVRIEYKSSGNTSGNHCRLLVTFGPGTDGAGTLTTDYTRGSTYIASTGSTTSARSNTTSYNSYCWCDEGSMLLSIAPATANGNGIYSDLILISRTCDADGAYNGNGIMVCSGYYNSTSAGVGWSSWSVTAAFVGVGSVTTNSPFNLCYPYRATQASTEYGSGVGSVHVAAHLTPEINWHKAFVLANAADAASGATFDVDVLGETHTYLSLGNGYKGVEAENSGDTTYTYGALAILWDAA